MKKTKANNTVNLLNIYKTKSGVWCFDDDDLGIVAEPFVGDINRMIDMHVDGNIKATIFISHSPFYKQTLSLTQTDQAKDIYQLDGTDIVGWFCPCLLNYFIDYPKNIYVKFQ